MGKISQDTARKASWKIVEPIKTKMDEIEKEISVLVTDIVVQAIPADVMKLWKKHSEYMKSNNDIRICGHGFDNRQVALTGSYPCEDTSWHKKMDITKEQAVELHKLDAKKEKLNDKYKTTQKEIEGTLLALGTTKRVLEQFPEAAAHLDITAPNTGLMLQIDPLREKVRCLICPDEEKACIEKL